MALSQQPDPVENDGRVVKFSPRGRTGPAAAPASPSAGGKAAGPRAPTPPAPVDYRQRMMANLAAALFAVVLAAVGVWLVSSLNHMRQVQDCIAMGLRNCDSIGSAPHS